jgi:hypothetical protein
MEVIASVASVGGIVSLAGQTLTGITTLRDFFTNWSSASKTIERFLRELNTLILAVEHVKELATSTNEALGRASSSSILASLRIQVEDCSNDVYRWLEIARRYQPDANSGAKASFKKFLVALNKQGLTDIFTAISAHKESLVLKMSVVGRYKINNTN